MEDQAAIRIEPFTQERLDALLALTIDIWSPVFGRMRVEMPDFVYRAFWPSGWEARQRAEVSAMCLDDQTSVHVALEDDRLIGFVGTRLHPQDRMGEIYILGVARDCQRKGVGRMLTDFALEQMRKNGCAMAMVETSSDSGHQSARAAYEAYGFRLWPVARYFREL